MNMLWWRINGLVCVLVVFCWTASASASTTKRNKTRSLHFLLDNFIKKLNHTKSNNNNNNNNIDVSMQDTSKCGKGASHGRRPLPPPAPPMRARNHDSHLTSNASMKPTTTAAAASITNDDVESINTNSSSTIVEQQAADLARYRFIPITSFFFFLAFFLVLFLYLVYLFTEF